MDVQINRIEDDLFELAKIGFREEDRGIYRQGFSDADFEARRWLMDKMRHMGLDVQMDGAGNVCGRLMPSEKEAAYRPVVIIGSHLDSVPAGGMFDGTLGVVAGLEVVRVLEENKISLNCPLEVIATSEEEGRFGGMLGAQALTGNLTLDWLEAAKDENGTYLKDAMAAQGLRHLDAMHAYRPADTMRAFLELHVEQGPVLENKQKTIGVVEGISGVFKWIVHLKGKADHAGTAPMDMRSDAFMGLAEFAQEIPRIIEEEGSDKSRITIGHVELKPGFPHTVPGEVVFTIVGRDLDGALMHDLARACRRVLSAKARKHKLMFEYEEMSWLEPQYCATALTDRAEGYCAERGYSHLRMPSGAGHDIQFFSPLIETALIFVPSCKGVSHAPDEWTHWSDIEKGANIMLDLTHDLVTEAK